MASDFALAPAGKTAVLSQADPLLSWNTGRLEPGLDEARKRGWVVASMKDDWKTVFPERTPK